jgi:GNAT superfamily N-acetyltransferase
MIEVRRVRDDEWRALRDLRLAALADSPDAFWTRYEEAIERTDEEWREWTSLPCHVAVEDGRLVGMVAGFPSRSDTETADLIAMFVAPEARGRGVGRALVEAQIRWAEGEGFGRVELMVNAQNDGAIRLYETLGFRDTGERAPLRDGPLVLGTMVRDLP